MKIKLSWFKPKGWKTGYWKKYYKGKTYYASHIKGRGKTDKDSYGLACEWWILKKSRIDAGLEDQTQENPSPTASLLTNLQREEIKKGISGNGNGDTRISSLIAAYLDKREHETKKADGIAPSTFCDYKTILNWFEREFVNVEYPAIYGQPLEDINQIDEDVLEKYRRIVEVNENSGNFGRVAANKRLKFIKKWIRWCYARNSLKALPRNLEDELREGKIPTPSPRFYSVEEAQKLFKAATQRTKLFIALGCNCGFLQSDIGTLRFSMIQIDQNDICHTIERLRHKTAKKSEVETRFKLWPVTLELLSREMAEKKNHDDLVLVNERGVSLYEQSLKGVRNNISFAFKKTRIAVFGKKPQSNPKAIPQPADNKGFKTFRKTSANLIAEEYKTMPFLAKMFLGHQERNHNITAAYISQQWDLLFEACDYLDTVYHFSLE